MTSRVSTTGSFHDPLLVIHSSVVVRPNQPLPYPLSHPCRLSYNYQHVTFIILSDANWGGESSESNVLVSMSDASLTSWWSSHRPCKKRRRAAWIPDLTNIPKSCPTSFENDARRRVGRESSQAHVRTRLGSNRSIDPANLPQQRDRESSMPRKYFWMSQRSRLMRSLP